MTRRIIAVVGLLGVVGCSGQKITVTPEQAAAGAACFAQLQTVVATARAQVSSCEALSRDVLTQVKASQ